MGHLLPACAADVRSRVLGQGGEWGWGGVCVGAGGWALKPVEHVVEANALFHALDAADLAHVVVVVQPLLLQRLVVVQLRLRAEEDLRRTTRHGVSAEAHGERGRTRLYSRAEDSAPSSGVVTSASGDGTCVSRSAALRQHMRLSESKYR